MTRNSDKPTVTVKEFPGLQTVNDDFEIANNGLSRALNVDITRQKKIRRRRGSTLVSALGGAVPLAAWGDDSALLITINDTLVSVDADYALTTIRTGMTQTDRLVATRIGKKIAYSNGVESGVIIDNHDHILGVAQPLKAVASPTNYGDMRAGRYQVVTTYVRDDGFESGAGIATNVVLTQDNTGLSVFHEASLNPDVVAINIYVSRADGVELYKAIQVANTTGSTVYNAHANFLGNALRTQFRVPPPVFDVITLSHNGRALYAVGDTVYLSDPYSYEHVMDGEAFVRFNDRVTIIATVEGGVFVGTELATYFITGDTIETIEMHRVAPYGAVFGTAAYMDGGLLGDGEVSDILPVWMSHKGLCVGMPNGVINNITQTSVVIPKGLKGTTMFRQENNQNHIVSVIQK